MRIDRFQFEDKKSGWQLEETRFDMFNLLVGASGVGKTKILKALEVVTRIATESDYRFGEVKWSIAFQHEGKSYQWEGETAAPASTAQQIGTNIVPSVEIVREQLISGEVLIDRTSERFVFGKGSPLPKLKRSESAIVLLSEESSIAPVTEGFRRTLFSGAAMVPRDFVPSVTVSKMFGHVKEEASKVDPHLVLEIVAKNSGLRSLTTAIVSTAYFLQERFPAEFQELISQFVSIFPSVSDVKILTSVENETTILDIAIKEEGGGDWIRQNEISSGMLRTFAHLIELYVAPAGSVIIIDEFENSLGVNCMSEVIDLVSKRADEIQYILTSHHPYIINNIPVKSWKVVKRHHNHVSVVSARDIPALNGASHHDAFIQLINLPEYEEGVS